MQAFVESEVQQNDVSPHPGLTNERLIVVDWNVPTSSDLTVWLVLTTCFVVVVRGPLGCRFFQVLLPLLHLHQGIVYQARVPRSQGQGHWAGSSEQWRCHPKYIGFYDWTTNGPQCLDQGIFLGRKWWHPRCLPKWKAEVHVVVKLVIVLCLVNWLYRWIICFRIKVAILETTSISRTLDGSAWRVKRSLYKGFNYSTKIEFTSTNKCNC